MSRLALVARTEPTTRLRSTREKPSRRPARHLGVAMPVQAKLEVSRPGDALEQEADRIAESVMKTSDPTNVSSAMAARRSVESNGLIQRKSSGASVATQAISEKIPALRASPGAPLTPGLRQFFERPFGRDFGDVRIHTEPNAVQSARALGARAFTVGHDIAFNHGEFAPHTTRGRTLLAHELTHVVQQSRTGHRVQRAVGECNDTSSPEKRFANDQPGQVFEVLGEEQCQGPGGRQQTCTTEFVLWNFCVGQSLLRSPEHNGALQRIGQSWAPLFGRSNLRVQVLGGASASGAATANLRLGQERAENVATALEGAGVPRNRIDVNSQGSARPFAPETTPENSARNRRVEVFLRVPVGVAPSLPQIGVIEQGGSPQIGTAELARTHRDLRRVVPRASRRLQISDFFDEGRNMAGIQARGAMVAAASVSVTSVVPSVVAFTQLVTRDLRRARMGTQPGQGQAARRLLDYGHCLGRIAPCRDVIDATKVVLEPTRGAIFRDVRTGPSGSASGSVFANDSPGVGVPIRFPDANSGPFFIEGFEWRMGFVIMLAAMDPGLGALEILEHAFWDVEADVDVRLDFSGPNAIRGRQFSPFVVINHGSFTSGPPPGIDVTRALNGPTCRSGARATSTDFATAEPCTPGVRSR